MHAKSVLDATKSTTHRPSSVCTVGPDSPQRQVFLHLVSQQAFGYERLRSSLME